MTGPSGRHARNLGAFAAILALLLVAQGLFHERDRSPQTWDPSLQAHLVYRFASALKSEGPGAIASEWHTPDTLYPPLYPMLNVAPALYGASVRDLRLAQSGWLLLLATLVFWSSARALGPLTASSVTLVACTAPLVLCLSRSTYIENLLVVLTTAIAIRLRAHGLPSAALDSLGFGLLLALAFLTKWSAAVTVAPALFGAIVAQRAAAKPLPRPRALLIVAAVAAALAAPWYLASGLHLVDRLLAEAYDKPAFVRPLLAFDSLAFYPVRGVAEAFWLPVGALVVGLLLASRRLPLPARRFWMITLLGALAILMASRHKQTRFFVQLVPLLALAAGEVLTTLPPGARRPLAGALVGLSLVPLVALSRDRTGPATVGARADAALLSPARGLPELLLGRPDARQWPHGPLLDQLASRGFGHADNPVFFQTGLRHPYLNRWTFRAEGWPRGVLFSYGPGRAGAILEIDPAVPGDAGSIIASARSPDGHFCVARTRDSRHRVP